MRGVEGKTGKRRVGVSYILLAVSIVVYVGSLAYSSYAAEWRAKAQTPRIDPILKIIKDLRQYQRTKATFPENFNQLDASVWKRSSPGNYGKDGRSLILAHYYYLYTRVDKERCTLWAIPIGPRSDDASSYFLILTPTGREKWKGPSLQLKEAATISGTPTYAELGVLGMVQQDPVKQLRR